ncbi:MAG: DEAD/DEAH box helicase [Bacteroidetes bacterium]|nr:DEAD/DEAH box helicase [Bacteroidota bacterium]
MIKNQQEILDKLGIEALNDMQLAARHALHAHAEIVLLSPTGTGKTLAFLLPLLSELDPEKEGVQAIIIAPSRELAMQIEQVARNMGTGYKINAVYGGRSAYQDKTDLKHPPALLIGTPGRLADHLRRDRIDTSNISWLVLDEFDKSLEIGFEDEMQEILESLGSLQKKVLTSATQGVAIPAFAEMNAVHLLDFTDQADSKLQLKAIISPEKDKLESLKDALYHFGDQPGIVFCNYKDSIQRVSDFLEAHNIHHARFHGGMEQKDREQALVQFRNGSTRVLLATDLAARGIDVPEIEYIIHYHLPHSAEEFTHRNGRTARMKKEGAAYVLHWENDVLPEFIPELEALDVQAANPPTAPDWKTIFVLGGRRDKISKGDLAGFFLKEGGLSKTELGLIELKPECAFVAVSADKAQQVIQKLDNRRLKKRKVRLSLIV